MLISTVPEMQDNLFLLKKVRAVNRRAKTFVTASTIDEALKLYENGADYVILPHFLGGEHASNLIEDIRMKHTDLKEERKTHIWALKKRKEIGQEHPKN